MSGVDSEAQTLTDLISTRGETLTDEVFTIQAETSQTLTYGQLDKQSNQVAGKLASIGISPGDKVGVIHRNSLESLIAICGILKRGAVCVPVNNEYKTRELQFVLNHTDCLAAIVGPDNSEDLINIQDETDINHILSVKDNSDLEYYKSDGIIETPQIRPVDTSLLMLTSGTTGDPKAVALSHLNLLVRIRGSSLLQDTNLYTWNPLYNIDGPLMSFTTMFNGRKQLLRDGFSASNFWEDAMKFDMTSSIVVPTILSIFLERGRPDDLDISSFSHFYVGGATVPEGLVQSFEEEFDIPACEGYGLTEASVSGFSHPDERMKGSAGTVGGYSEVKIVNEDGVECPPNEPGEILVRGPAVFKGYYNNQEATDEAIQGGWFYTGDIGYRDSEGEMYIKDRIKDVIIRGGQNIYPGEVEEVILDIDGIQKVAVIGKDHSMYGEVPVAVVQTNSDWRKTELESIVEEKCSEELSEYKIPQEVKEIGSFPHGETHKILKEELKGDAL